MYEPVFSRPLWPAAQMQYIFPECRASGWVYLQSSFISPGLICLKYPADWLHSWHHLNKDSFAFMGSWSLVTMSSLTPETNRKSWIGNREGKANFLNSHNYFTTAVRFIFGHDELEVQGFLCFSGHLWFLSIFVGWNNCRRTNLSHSQTLDCIILSLMNNVLCDKYQTSSNRGFL